MKVYCFNCGHTWEQPELLHVTKMCQVCRKHLDPEHSDTQVICSQHRTRVQEKIQQNHLRQIARTLNISAPVVGWLDFTILIKKIEEHHKKIVAEINILNQKISQKEIDYQNKIETLKNRLRLLEESKDEIISNRDDEIYELQEQLRQEREKNQELTRQLQAQQNQQRFETHTSLPPRRNY